MLNIKTEAKLVAALRHAELVSADIRKITGWTAPKMSIRLATGRVAARAGLRMKVRTAKHDGRKLLTYSFVATKKAA